MAIDTKHDSNMLSLYITFNFLIFQSFTLGPMLEITRRGPLFYVLYSLWSLVYSFLNEKILLLVKMFIDFLDLHTMHFLQELAQVGLLL